MNALCLTLDLINELCHPDGKLASAASRVAANDVIGKANTVLRWARRQRHLVAHVKVGFGPDYIQCPEASPLFGAAKKLGALQLGTWGTEFCEALSVEEGEPTIIKHRVSAFYGTELETILRARRINRLILMGVSTHNAVELTAREAHDRDCLVTVVGDACESDNQASHETSLRFLARIATVTTAADIAG